MNQQFCVHLGRPELASLSAGRSTGCHVLKRRFAWALQRLPRLRPVMAVAHLPPPPFYSWLIFLRHSNLILLLVTIPTSIHL